MTSPASQDPGPDLPSLDKLQFGDPAQIKALGLSKRQFTFCVEYLKDQNGKQAAIRAGYSKKNAESIASRLLKRPKVQEFLRVHMKKAEERAEITVAEIIHEIARLAFVDVGKIFDEDNNLKDVKEWPEEIRRAVSSVEIEDLFEGHGKEREHVGYTKKVKLWDKTKALELLGRWRKLFTDKIEINDKSSLADRLKRARERAGAAGKGKAA